MKVSRRSPWSSQGGGKTEVAVTDRKVSIAIGTTMGRLGVREKTKVPHFGLLFQPGGKTRAPPIFASRWAAGVKRRIGAQRMGQWLGHLSFRTGIVPAAMYGATVAYQLVATIQ